MRLFELLNDELARTDTHAEVCMVGGAVMCLALKCMAMRLGEEFQDLDDVRYLLRHLNITTALAAIAVATQCFDETQIPVKTRLALEGMLERKHS